MSAKVGIWPGLIVLTSIKNNKCFIIDVIIKKNSHLIKDVISLHTLILKVLLISGAW